MLNSEFKNYNPTKREQELVNHIESLRVKMDTPYRLRWRSLAKWARDEYEGMSDEKVSNMDLLKIQMSYPIINQRMSTIQANQSSASFKTVDEDKEDEIKIFKQTDQYDKDVGRYNSRYFDIEQTAQIEGTCFASVYWHENQDENGNTIGVPSTQIRRVRINDFWWDQSARWIKDMNHGIEREVIGYQEFHRRYFPKIGQEGYKHIESVRPMKADVASSQTWNEDWAEKGRDVYGDYVSLWHFESLSFYEDGVWRPKNVTIANGCLIYESDKLMIPKVTENDPEMLRWTKIDGIPTGQMIAMGIPVLIRHPQQAFNRLLTLSVAQSELAVIPPLFVRPGADQDLDDYPGEAGSIVPIRGSGKSITEDYQFLQVPDITSGAQKMMADLIEYVIMVTGVDIRALFEPASQKAITTENKREIQQKMLRFSVQWNEENGMYDLQLMRNRLMQKYYPEKRSFLGENGEVNVRYLQVPMKDMEVIEGRQDKIKLNFKRGGYTKIDITPENLRFNIDFTIEGTFSKEERDVLQKRAFMEDLQLIMSIPMFQELLSQNKESILKMILKKANIPEDVVFEAQSSDAQQMHPALKEIAAIRLVDALNSQGIRIPEDIPQPEDYNPAEYAEVFSEYVTSRNYDAMSRKSKDIFDTRMIYHQNNALNPYFMDMRVKSEMEAAEQPAPAATFTKVEMKADGGDDTLATRTRQRAGQIGAATRAQ